MVQNHLVAQSFYEPAGDDKYLSGDWTRGPWGSDSQHGGPPAALLGRAVEQTIADDEMQVVRVAFDLFGPVPVAPLELRTEVVRPGKRVRLVTAELHSSGEVIMRATAWCIRTETVDLPPQPEIMPPPPPDSAHAPEYFRGGEPSYLAAMDIRFVSGDFFEPGPAVTWMRAKIPLLPDEPLSPLGRVLCASDSGSGVSAQLDFSKWLFINPNLDVHVSRLPEGDWVCLDARTVVEQHGVGLAATVIFDEKGHVGRGLQSLLVGPLR